MTARNSPRPALRVTVLAGGPSAERDVSLESGRAVADSLRRAGHDVFMSDISPENLSALDHPADVVFPVLHGTFGEDGQVQRIMEQRGMRYVGSDSRASAIAIDKVHTKRVAVTGGIRTPAYRVCSHALSADDWPSDQLPAVVKPVDQGSSVSTHICRTLEDLRRAVGDVADRYSRALVEQFISGEELTVGILGNQVLPPLAIRPRTGFYDYDAKYRKEDTEYLFETGHPAAVFQRAGEQSLRVFAGVGCRHMARVDWIIDRDNELWFLEVNTIPGFTSHSLLPKAAARAGLPFDELTDKLVRMAFGATG
ncbi:MAG: D-alanine--D-alanine ligase [Phycisphaerae bacterium]|nr:D-alanine--D-alanine ligase [Phycisphaerae bacterium]